MGQLAKSGGQRLVDSCQRLHDAVEVGLHPSRQATTSSTLATSGARAGSVAEARACGVGPSGSPGAGLLGVRVRQRARERLAAPSFDLDAFVHGGKIVTEAP